MYIAGYMMAGAGFLALAHTLKRGEHIRVTLLQAPVPKAKHRLELLALAAALLLSLLLAVFSVKLCWQSLQFNDISTGNDATPLDSANRDGTGNSHSCSRIHR